MKVLFHTRTASEMDWAKQVIELHRLPCVGEYISVPVAGVEESTRHEVRLVLCHV